MRAAVLAAAAVAAAIAAPSFQVANDRFELNGQEVTLMSGSFHYHRAHSSTWRDRLTRMAAMGLNAVQFYVPWNFHEVSPGVFDFGQYSPDRNLSAFLSTAQDVGLLALVRAGPYICGEHDFGGFPARLLNISGIVLRTNNTQYLAEVDVYWTAVMNVIKPHLVSNGGNVAMVQVENEFGSYGNTGGNPADAAYVRHLKDATYAALGGPTAVQLYTTDGGSAGYFTHGALPGEIFVTGDGGPDIDPPSFWAAEDQFNPPGWRAHTDSEYYTGWLTHWGEGMANTSTLAVVSGISVILNYNGSFNLYMAYGGTNWGFRNGANGGGTSFQPVITSYDYNSPIAEGGTHGYSSDGDKFLAMRRVLAYWAPFKGRTTPFPAEPPQPVATAYAPAVLSSYVPLMSAPTLSTLSIGGGGKTTPTPLTLEAYGQSQGYAVFTTPLPAGLPAGKAATLSFGFVADLAYVWCTPDSSSPLSSPIYLGDMWRPTGTYNLPIPAACVQGNGKQGGLIVLLSNAGHINYGHGLFDPKGLFPSGGPGNSGPVGTVGGMPLPGPWTAYNMEMHYNETIAKLGPMYAPAPNGGVSGPAFFSGTLSIPPTSTPTDTFITLCGWGKGTVWVNGFHIGRYWEAQGPQHAFYIPAAMLVPGSNSLVVFEEVQAPSGYTVGFTNGPDFTGAVCKQGKEKEGEKKEKVVLGMTRKEAPTTHLRPASSSSTASCPTTFTAGQAVTMQPCASAGPASQWNIITMDKASETVVLQLKANPALCLAVNDTAKSVAVSRPVQHRAEVLNVGQAVPQAMLPRALQSLQTNIVLAPCAPGNTDRGQHFMYFSDLPTRSLMSVTRGNCLDVTGGSTAPGVQLEVYGCTGNSNNQGWNVNMGAGQVTSAGSGLCISAC